VEELEEMLNTLHLKDLNEKQLKKKVEELKKITRRNNSIKC